MVSIYCEITFLLNIVPFLLLKNILFKITYLTASNLGYIVSVENIFLLFFFQCPDRSKKKKNPVYLTLRLTQCTFFCRKIAMKKVEYILERTVF